MNTACAGAFETFRITDGKIFAFGNHMERLWRACKILNVPMPSEAKIKNKLKSITKITGDYRAKIIANAAGKVEIIAKSLPKLKFEKVSCCFTSAIPSQYPFKSTDRREYERCEKIAKSKGFDLPLLTDAKIGYVLESSIANVFIVKDGVVSTPPIKGIVNGVARKTVLSLCKKLGIKAKIKKMARNDVRSSDEIFLTNALRFVFGVSRIGRKKYGCSISKLLFSKYALVAEHTSERL